MTEKQKKAFLKFQGWVCRSVAMNLWKDPNSGISYYGYRALEIASRRKRQREGSKLRRAGWRYFSGAWWHKSITHVVAKGWYTDGIKVQTPHTRQEALQTLEAQP